MNRPTLSAYFATLTFALLVLSGALGAQGVDPAKVKAYADSISRETCRGGTLSASGLTCTGATAAARVTWLRRFANGLRALPVVTPPVPPPPPVDTQPTPPPPPPADTTPTPPPPPPVSSGAAELPRVYLTFAYPTKTGQTITVPSGGNLQAALNTAQRGDEIVLAAGATFSGTYTLPAKSGTGWIMVRTSGTLPPIGTRVRPSHAAQMPKLVTTNTDPALKLAAGASGWWLSGLEVTITPTVTAQNYGLIFLGYSSDLQKTTASVPTDLVLDRLYVHGQASTQLSRCVALNSARTQVSDSWLSECHGKGFDSQAIGGWNGPGPYKIVNNMLEGAGENLMFGGADPGIPGLVPSDIEIRGNHLYTPLAWKGVWSKKNLFELKNAARVLMEGNVLDGSWTDGQTGWAVILKSGNQSGGCRWCRTTDVTFRWNLIRNVGAGIAVAPRDDNPNTDTTARRISISETVLEVGTQPGDSRGFQLLAGVQSVTVERTVLSGSFTAALISEGGAPCTFRDNTWARGTYGVIATGASPGLPSLTKGCGATLTWAGMTFVGTSNAVYPAGTTWAAAEPAQAATIRQTVSQLTAGVVVPP